MGTISGTTHECGRGEIEDDDDGCLYTSFRSVNGTLKSSNNKCIQHLIADYILKQKNLHPAVLKIDPKYKTIKDYCNEIKEGKLRGGKIELQALAMISKIIIRVISIKTTIENNNNIEILNYGEHVESFEECVYMFYDHKKNYYTPLCIINKKDPNKKLTIFSRYDQTVSELFVEFIREKHHDKDFIEFDRENASTEAAEPTVSNKTDCIEQMVILEAGTKFTKKPELTKKRKLSNYTTHSSVSFGNIVDPEPSSSVCNNNNNIIDKPTKRTKIGTNPAFDRNENQSRSNTTVRNSSINRTTNEIVVPVNQQLTTNSSIGMTFEFEFEPALKFRGRTRGDFKPKKQKTRKGKLSTARPPRYFADRNNKRVFNLLISEEFLSLDVNAEYRLVIHLITGEINRCSYIHPYFKFQGDSTDQQIPDENPKYVSFTMADLKQHSQGIKQFSLKLVVVQQTNPELMQVKQPLQIFSSSNNASAIKKTYKEHLVFKRAYHLHDLRFVVTLCKKEPGETDFHQCDNIRYISQISTEQKKYKISKKK